MFGLYYDYKLHIIEGIHLYQVINYNGEKFYYKYITLQTHTTFFTRFRHEGRGVGGTG